MRGLTSLPRDRLPRTAKNTAAYTASALTKRLSNQPPVKKNPKTNQTRRRNVLSQPNSQDTPVTTPANINESQCSGSPICGTCSMLTDADAIGCDHCQVWYHPVPLCMGLPEEVIQTIQQYGGAGVLYQCTTCRTFDPKT